MKIVVITGEESGDKLAASAIKELKKISNEPLKIFGIGGRALEKEGIQKFFDISDINVMGLIEVIPKIFKINRIIKSVVNQIIELDPDIIFTVDSPDFTLRIAERIKKRNNKLLFVFLFVCDKPLIEIKNALYTANNICLPNYLSDLC